MLLLEGAAIALVSMLVGRFLPARRRKAQTPGADQAICGCSHPYALHDEHGRCHEKVKRFIWEQCGCHRYSGPEPLPSFTAEIGG